jgi:hypothetical protein
MLTKLRFITTGENVQKKQCPYYTEINFISEKIVGARGKLVLLTIACSEYGRERVFN